MRLVDANEILRSENKRYMDHEYYVFARAIEDAPTVEAIPIEWIKEWVNNYCDWSQEKLIEVLLRTWNKMDKERKDVETD